MERFSVRAQCVTLLFVAVASFGCKQKEKFPELASKFSGPDLVAVNDAGTNFYVLNTDFERIYNTASIVVLDESGAKVGVVETPRLGRMLRVAGTHLLAGFDRESADEPTQVILYDITDPTRPVQKQSWYTDSVPMNAFVLKDYKHFAVTLLNGQIMLGTFDDAGGATLTKVRDYGVFRRALYIDPQRELLFAFTTDFAAPSMEDRAGVVDELSYDINGVLIPDAGPNDVPDNMEQNIKAIRAEAGNRQLYQFVVYDIAKERAAGFPFRLLDDVEDKTTTNELRWLYFTLTSKEGIPDSTDEYENPNHHTYRTNIWDAAADPDDPDAFYFSQRGGLNGGAFANNVVRARIVGSLAAVDNKVPRTSTYLKFERVFGFKGEVTKQSYPGNINIANVDGLPLLTLTDSRDQVYWKDENLIYSLTSKTLDGTEWYSQLRTSDHELSYSGVAVNQRGVGVSCSYYGSKVVLFKVQPGVELGSVQVIE